MELVKSINLGIRFLLEVLALIIYCYWGFHRDGLILKMILGIGTPLLAAVLWGTFGAPKAAYKAEGFTHLLLEIIIFGFAAVALYFSDKSSLANLYGIIFIVNLILLKLWNQ
jgi:hypothetical protein